MITLQTRLLCLSLFALTGCFMSEAPHIKDGVSLAEGPVAFCIPDDPPCQTGYPEGDGYRIPAKAEDEEDMILRFEVLSEANTVPVYIGEAELREGEESAWAYVLARDAGEGPEGPAQFYIRMPDCKDIDEADHARAGVKRADAYTCEVSDFARFRTYLVELHKADFADSEFWTGTP